VTVPTIRPSKWTYDTGATGGASVEFIVASGGEIILRDPSQKKVTFYYGGAGLGVGLGINLSKLKIPHFSLPNIAMPKIFGRDVSAAGSLESYSSVGTIFMTSAFRGSELTKSDFQGGAVYIDAGAGLIYGRSASAMLLGIHSAKLATGLSSASTIWLAEEAIFEARAILLMYGTTTGLIAGGSIGILAGSLT